MNKIPNRSTRIFRFFGKRKRFSNPARNALFEGTIESLDMIGFAGFFTNRLMTVCWKNNLISLPKVRIKASVLTLTVGNGLPQASTMNTNNSRVSRSIAKQIHCLSFLTQTTTFHRTLPLSSALFSHAPSRFLVALRISCSHTFATGAMLTIRTLHFSGFGWVKFLIISNHSVFMTTSS
jgi:hypothetical protein